MLSFTDLSQDIVCEFLHNVVLADDRIDFNTDALPARIVTPTRETCAESNISPEINPSEKVINVKPILDGFMARGIPCSLISLDDSLQPEIYFKNLRKSDAMILDWQVKSDDGEFILQILKKLIDEDKKSLKVILIYTGLPDLVSIINKITTAFPEVPFEPNDAHGCSIRYGSTLISVYAKTDISIPHHLLHRYIKEEQLVEALIHEFTGITSGLVSNAAIRSISVIRQNTHKLLDQFNKQLDPAFLAHRSLLPVVDDAGELLKESIINSIKAILDYNYIELECSIKPIKKWIENFSFSSKEMSVQSRRLTISKPEIIKWQQDGFIKMAKEIWAQQFPLIQIDNDKLLNLYNKEIHKKIAVINYFLPDENVDISLEEKFSVLTHHKSNFSNPTYIPRLTLGSIIQGQRSKAYWLCVQQKCDSVRLDGNPRRFLFLPLVNSEENKNFNFVLPTEDSFQKVRVDIETHCLRTIKFIGNKEGCVYARKFGKSKNYFFIQFYKDQTIDENFKWILDLKDAHAQRIANTYAAKLSRVGLDESEWLRRWSGN